MIINLIVPKSYQMQYRNINKAWRNPMDYVAVGYNIKKYSNTKIYH